MGGSFDDTPKKPVGLDHSASILTPLNSRISSSYNQTLDAPLSPWIFSPLLSEERQSEQSSCKTMVDFVFRDLSELTQLQKAEREVTIVSVSSWDAERVKRIRKRLFAFLDTHRDTKAAERLKYVTDDEIKKCSQEEWWATYVLQLSKAKDEDEHNIVEVSTRKAIEELDAVTMRIICDSFIAAVTDHASPPPDATEQQRLKKEFETYLKERRNEENLIQHLGSLQTREQLIQFQKKAEERHNQAIEDSLNAQTPVALYEASLSDLNRIINRDNSAMKSGLSLSADALIAITHSNTQQETLLNKTLSLADGELIDAVLDYAEHLDTGSDDLPSHSTNNKATLISKTLKKIINSQGKISDLKAFLCLVNSGCLYDANLVTQLQQYSVLPSLFDDKNQLTLDIKALLSNASEEILSDLMDIAKGAFDKTLMEVIGTRYQINEQPPTTNIPSAILRALKKRAAKTERFEYLTNLFAKALSHVCKNYNEKYSEHYQHKLHVILDNIQKTSDIQTEKGLLAQAEIMANNILDNKEDSNIDQYRDKSSFHIQAPKTVRLIKEVIKPSCSFTGLFSTKKAAIHPFNDAISTHSEQVVNMKKSEITQLIEKGDRSEEAQRRAVLAAHVFENTLRYLDKRSKSTWKKIAASFSSKPSLQELLNDSENNDPKYRALMDVINRFIHNEDQHAVAELFDQLDNEQSNVHKILYAKNWSFVTFKSQTLRKLEKDVAKRELLTSAMTV